MRGFALGCLAVFLAWAFAPLTMLALSVVVVGLLYVAWPLLLIIGLLVLGVCLTVKECKRGKETSS